MSKTLGFDFIAMATKLIVGEDVDKVDVLRGTGEKYGIKVSYYVLFFFWSRKFKHLKVISVIIE